MEPFGRDFRGRKEPVISALNDKFRDLVDGHYDGLWRYARWLTAGAADSEDIVHDAFLLAFDRLAEGVRFEGDPGKWLRGTLRNLTLAWWRKQRNAPADLAEHILARAEEAEDALDGLMAAEMESALTRCLEKLGAEDRRLVGRRYGDGWSVTQIAEQWKVNMASLRVRLFRVRLALKECMERRLSRGGLS